MSLGLFLSVNSDFFTDEPESISTYLSFRVNDFLVEAALEKTLDDKEIRLSHAKADLVNSLLIPALESTYGGMVFDPRSFTRDMLVSICEEAEKLVDNILLQRKDSSFVDPRYFTYGGSTVLVVLYKISIELLNEGVYLKIPSKERIDAMMDKFDLFELYYGEKTE